MTKEISTRSLFLTKRFTNIEDLLVGMFVEKETTKELILAAASNCLYDFFFIIDSSEKELIEFIKEKQYKIFIKEKEYENDELLRKCFKYCFKNNYRFFLQFEVNKFYSISSSISLHDACVKGYDLAVAEREVEGIELPKKAKSIIKYLKLKNVFINDPFCNFRIFNWNIMKFYLENPKLNIDCTSYPKLVKKENAKITSVKIKINDKSDFSYEKVDDMSCSKFKILF